MVGLEVGEPSMYQEAGEKPYRALSPPMKPFASGFLRAMSCASAL